MKARHLIILTILILFVQSVAFGQTNEFQYFYHSEYFNDSTIKEHKIKKISVTSFWTRPQGEIYQDQKNIYSFNELGDLLCSESYYYKENDPQIVTQQTIDCYEYANRLLTRHLRYHNNIDSAEWFRQFRYVFDKNKNITKVIVEDRSHPHNSTITEKIYDSKNRIITEKTDYGYVTEYRYDPRGILIERIWGPKDGPRYHNVYSYDNAGKLIKYERTPKERYETIKESSKYDSQGRIILKESVSTENVKSQTKYSYEERNTIMTEHLNKKGEVYSITTQKFSNGLIQSEITVKNGVVHSKEIYGYKFNKN